MGAAARWEVLHVASSGRRLDDPVRRDCRVLVRDVRTAIGRAARCGRQRPAVGGLHDVRRARGQKRLDRDHQTFIQDRGVAAIEDVRDVRIFVDEAADAVSAVVPSVGATLPVCAVFPAADAGLGLVTMGLMEIAIS